jgi:peroxiredoxin Q/BCP
MNDRFCRFFVRPLFIQLKKNYGREYYGVVRSTVLIDPEGKIAYIWPKVKAKGHADMVKVKLEEIIG